MLLVVLSLLSSAWAQSSPDRAPAIIDRVVVVVGPRVITASELRLSIAMDAHDSSPIEVLRGHTADPQERLVNRRILRSLAGEVRVYQPAEVDVRARLDKLKTSWVQLSDYRIFLLRNGLDEERLLRELAERMVVERYIRRNLAGQGDAQPTMAQYRKWMAQYRADVRIRKVAPSPEQP